MIFLSIIIIGLGIPVAIATWEHTGSRWQKKIHSQRQYSHQEWLDWLDKVNASVEDKSVYDDRGFDEG